jgi:type II secretory pathway pseudopilin PulG
VIWAPRTGGDAGLSLVEVTIILMVVAVLVAAVAPSAGTYSESARAAKAKSDTETIGAAIDELLRNTGLTCLSKAPTAALTPAASAPCSLTNRVELAVSGPALNTNEPAVVTTAFATSAAVASAANVNWAGGANEVADASKDLLDNHLVTNTVGYTAVSFTSGGGPRPALGWRGAYVAGPIDVDPWGYVYQVNTLFLAVAQNATNSTGSGELRGGWTQDVLVVSSGSNGLVQTDFGAAAAAAGGDDVVYVLQGATR